MSVWHNFLSALLFTIKLSRAFHRFLNFTQFFKYTSVKRIRIYRSFRSWFTLICLILTFSFYFESIYTSIHLFILAFILITTLHFGWNQYLYISISFSFMSTSNNMTIQRWIRNALPFKVWITGRATSLWALISVC